MIVTTRGGYAAGAARLRVTASGAALLQGTGLPATALVQGTSVPAAAADAFGQVWRKRPAFEHDSAPPV